MIDRENEADPDAAHPAIGEAKSDSATTEPPYQPQAASFFVIQALILIGFCLSAALEYVHVETYLDPAVDSFCAVGPSFDCAAVAASKYSIFLGLPWAVWGMLGFLALFIAALRRSFWLLPLGGLLALGSLLLLAVSIFFVGSVCYLCEATHLIAWLLLYFVVRARGALRDGPGRFGKAMDIFAAPAGRAVALLIFLPNYWAAFSYRSAPPYPTGTTKDGHPWIGSPAPKATLEEYVDYTCPHCRARSASTLRALARHPELRVVRRQQPRMSCSARIPSSCHAARMALCAQQQEAFWRADRWLFAHTERRGELSEQEMARDLGLDSARFRSCVASEETYDRANSEYKAALRAGIRFVPGHKVNGKRLKEGELEKLLD